MVSITGYKVLPQLSVINEPVEVNFKIQSDVEGEINIVTLLVIDIVYKKLEVPLCESGFILTKDTKVICLNVILYLFSLISLC
jgi:hypothetical protein